MKYRSAILIVLGAATAMGQVASHAPALNAGTPATAPAPSGSVSSMQVTGKVVARVNGAELTDRDLLREMMIIFPYAGTHNGFPREMEPSIRNGALKMIEFEELVYQDAVRRKLTVPPVQMSKAVTSFRDQFQDDDQFKQYVKVEMNGSMAEFRKTLRRSLLIEELLKSDVETPADVTVAEARQFYIKNPQPFTHPDLIQFQTISFLPDEKASAEVKEKAHQQAGEIWKQAKDAKNYEEFGLLAEKYSQDDFRVDMGNHKLAPRTALPPEVMKILDPMKPGQVSNVCQFGSYYTILRLEARVPAGKVPFTEVRAKLQQDMQQDRYNTLRATLDKKLRAHAKVEEL